MDRLLGFARSDYLRERRALEKLQYIAGIIHTMSGRNKVIAFAIVAIVILLVSVLTSYLITKSIYFYSTKSIDTAAASWIYVTAVLLAVLYVSCYRIMPNSKWFIRIVLFGVVCAMVLLCHLPWLVSVWKSGSVKWLLGFG